MKRIQFFFVAAATLCAAFWAPATTRYVDVNNSAPVFPFTNWVSAATNIQDAVDAAVGGDEVVVTNGLYAEGGRAVYGTMTNRVAIAKAIAVRSVNGPLLTTIQGLGVGTGATNGEGAIRCAYVGSSALLSGFTLTNGHTQASGDYTNEQSGGGAWCEASGMVTNCTLNGCSAYYRGGGAYSGVLHSCIVSSNSASGTNGCGGGAYGSTLNNCALSGNFSTSGIFGDHVYGGGAYGCTLYNCALSGNSVRPPDGGTGYGYGGGAYGSALTNCALSLNSADNGGGADSSTLYNCTVISNSAGYGGGANSSTLYSCTLRGNSAHGTGYGGGARSGALYNCALISNSAGYGGGANSATMFNCAVIGNSAASGGGVYYGTLNNCTLVGNTATFGGGSYGYVYPGGINGAVLNNCIVYYNSARYDPNNSYSTLNYSCTTPLPPGVSNITNAPLFVNTNGWANLRLQAGSSCINAGTNAYAMGATDLDGRPRIVGGVVDMGAYEFQPGADGAFIGWLQSYSLPTDGSADYSDPDGDGMNNWQEWVAGTDPTNPASVLRMLSANPGATNVVVTWSSVDTRAYSLARATNLGPVPALSIVWSNIAGLAGMTTFADTNPPAGGAAFYRVAVQPP